MQILKEKLVEKESLITGYCSKLSQAETHLRQITDEKERLSEEIRMDKAKWELVRNYTYCVYYVRTYVYVRSYVVCI